MAVRNRVDGVILITIIFLLLVGFAFAQALSPTPSAEIQLMNAKNAVAVDCVDGVETTQGNNVAVEQGLGS